MITAQEVNDWISSPIPKSIEQIENNVKRLADSGARMINIKLIGVDGNPLIVISYAVEHLLTAKGKLRADVRKLIKPHLPRTDRMSVTV